MRVVARQPVAIRACLLAVLVLAGGCSDEPPDAPGPDDKPQAQWAFDPAEAARRQARQAENLNVPTHVTLDLGGGVSLDLVLIPSMAYIRGPGRAEARRYDDPGPGGSAESLPPFYMSVTEITQAQWLAVMGPPGPWQGETYARAGADHAASYVSWNDAMAFCQALTARLAARSVQGADRKFALPGETQWELACRAGSAGPFGYGDDDAEHLGDYAWYDANAGSRGEDYAHGVAGKKPNAWGLYDMHGNVWEWCRDAGGNANSPGRSPAVSASGYCVLRGGSCVSDAPHCRAATRRRARATHRNYAFGFRVVSPPPTGQTEP